MTYEQQALENEQQRLNYLQFKMDELTNEYHVANECWEKKKNEYLAKLNTLNVSIKGAKDYIERLKQKL